MMSTASKVDPSTLGWVKAEIDETLKQARLALESYSENPGDEAQLRFCITYLHQVLGTLQMVELDGAARLAGEVESLARALLEKQVPVDQKTFELLIRAVLFLPEYLARLQAGYPDIPLRMLPIINEMRASRGASALPALDFFAPDLSHSPPGSTDRMRIPIEEFQASLKRLRPGYQASLLAWLKDPGNSVELTKISDAIAQLQQESATISAERLFWIAGGLLTALASGALDVTNDRKRLLGRIEQQMKRLGDAPEDPAAREASEALSKAMLFEIGQAKTNDPPIGEIRRIFDLDTQLGADDQAADEAMPTPEALQSVSQALGKEIETAQDLLAAYFDSSREDVQSLEPLVSLLQKMSGTLEMLNVKPIQALVDALVETARAIIEGAIPSDDAVSMQMASALLFVENGAREISNGATAWKRQMDERIAALTALRTGEAGASLEGIEISDAALSEGEFKLLLSAVSAEIRVNLNRVEEAIETIARSPADKQSIEAVPQFLTQIQGALEILGQEQAASLVVRTREIIEDIQAGRLSPERSVLEGVAVAVGTIEAYLEGLERDRPQLDSLIASALQELEASLQAKPEPMPEPELEPEFEAVSLPEPTIEALPVGEEVSEASSPWSASPPPASEPIATDNKSSTEDEDFDAEMMQIFIEDAKDVYQLIVRSLAAWTASPEDKNAFLDLRRGYHTLKGSGRMVGASEIAELAWSFESMLNQVREGKLTQSPAMLALLQEVEAVIPGMIAELEGGPATGVDTDALRERAAEIAAGKLPPAPVQAEAAPAAPPAEVMPVLDPVLLQIFTTEASGHLATLKSFVDNGGGMVERGLIRAVHTLLGNGRSLQLGSMAKVSGELENYLDILAARQLPVDDSMLPPISEVHAGIEQILVNLNSGDAFPAEVTGVFARLCETFRIERERLGNEPEPEIELEDVASPVVAEPASDSWLSPEFEIDAPPPPDETITLEGIAPADFPGNTTQAEAAMPEPKIEPAPVVRASAPAPAARAEEADAVEDIDPELLEIFREEAVDILEQIEEAVTKWRANNADKAVVPSLKRSLHTLKGGARMAGIMSMGTLSHNTESLLRQVEEGRVVAGDPLFDLLDEVHDLLVTMLKRVASKRSVSLPEVRILNDKILAAIEGGAVPAYVEARPSAGSEAGDPSVPAAREVDASSFLAEATNGEATDETEDEDASRADGNERREHIRVRTNLLSELVNYAGEVSIARSRMEQQVTGLREHLAELSRNVVRFRSQIRELEIQSESQILYRAEEAAASTQPDFDPLEFDRFSRLQHLSRGLAESLHDLTVIQSTLDNFVGEAETALVQQARVNTELQEGLMRTRMINFSTQAARLRHIARQTSRELGKRVEVVIAGNEVEVDRNVLERMIGPFEHMIRNAIDHGIESEQERKRLRKPVSGTITIKTSQEASEIVIRFSDDGAGLNVKAIRKKAIERGLMKADADLTDEETMQFILLPGFSTAEKITHVSGRGVGMDVVHSEVKQLGGSITVETQPGAGTTFVVRLPLTLSITQALMVRAGDQLFAVPISSVVNIVETPVEKISSLSMGDKPLFHHGEEVYPFMHLAGRLGLSSSTDARKVPVLIAKSGARQIAIQIDGLAGTREVVIKTLGPQLAEIKGIAGATVLGDGKVVLILDVAGLWLTEESTNFIRAREPVAPVVVEEEQRRMIVMVVDDSLTVRKITTRHLQKRGFDVQIAKDGLDAWEQLRGDQPAPDVMLVDIEMPRMDGYELTGHIRADSKLKRIPIIMITSRAGTKHRDRALALGVNIYMSKPYQEDELVKNIESLLPAGAVH